MACFNNDINQDIEELSMKIINERISNIIPISITVCIMIEISEKKGLISTPQ